MEFSRKLREYKTLYSLHSTLVFNESARQAFVDSAPYVAHIVERIFVSNKALAAAESNLVI
jgi:hypothetical protein